MATRSINPIIPGFAPDPSVCLVGDIYFLVTSSFNLFPGLPIYASTDLFTWKHIGEFVSFKHVDVLDLNYPLGNAINRRSQMSFRTATTFIVPLEDGENMIATGGLYAPTIRHHNGTTYIVCTNVVHRSGTREDGEHAENFIIRTDDVWSNNWSDPTYYDFPGIDPSLFFDDDGKVYLQGSKTPDFHIYNFEIDLSTGETGAQKLIWAGWDKRFTEGPHVYKKDGYYYLLCAEGGTFDFHMLSMARARHIWGPYESCERNPILTAHNTRNYVQNTGHGDLFQDKDGMWWIVMLGVRIREGRFAMGRESFLSSVEWADGDWPVVEPVRLDIDGRGIANGRRPWPGIKSADGADWVYLRDPDLTKFRISGCSVTVAASPNDLSTAMDPVSFVGKRQRLLEGRATVRLNRSTISAQANFKAGICLLKDEHRYLSLSFESKFRRLLFERVNLAKDLKTSAQFAITSNSPILLRISYSEMGYKFYFAPERDDEWVAAGTVDALDMSGLDFTGPIIGLFAIGDGCDAVFENFAVD
jgi:beta-xylosidase